MWPITYNPEILDYTLFFAFGKNVMIVMDMKDVFFKTGN